MSPKKISLLAMDNINFKNIEIKHKMSEMLLVHVYLLQTVLKLHKKRSFKKTIFFLIGEPEESEISSLSKSEEDVYSLREIIRH